MAKDKDERKKRNWLAIHAHNKKAGPMKDRREPRGGANKEDYCPLCGYELDYCICDDYWAYKSQKTPSGCFHLKSFYYKSLTSLISYDPI